MRSVLLYGAETWAATKQLEALLIQCDVRMLRYFMGIRWQDGISNEEDAGHWCDISFLFYLGLFNTFLDIFKSLCLYLILLLHSFYIIFYFIWRFLYLY